MMQDPHLPPHPPLTCAHINVHTRACTHRDADGDLCENYQVQSKGADYVEDGQKFKVRKRDREREIKKLRRPSWGELTFLILLSLLTPPTPLTLVIMLTLLILLTSRTSKTRLIPPNPLTLLTLPILGTLLMPLTLLTLLTLNCVTLRCWWWVTPSVARAPSSTDTHGTHSQMTTSSRYSDRERKKERERSWLREREQ
jgi:hypothetical protein